MKIELTRDMSDIKEYRVTVDVHLWASSPKDALKRVRTDMDFLVDNKTDGDISWYFPPSIDDVRET